MQKIQSVPFEKVNVNGALLMYLNQSVYAKIFL